jgi:hypothetical protein
VLDRQSAFTIETEVAVFGLTSARLSRYFKAGVGDIASW